MRRTQIQPGLPRPLPGPPQPCLATPLPATSHSRARKTGLAAAGPVVSEQARRDAKPVQVVWPARHFDQLR